MRKITLLIVVYFAICSLAFSQTTFSWRNDQNPTSGQWNVVNYWWNGAGPALPGGGEILYLDGSVGTTMTNDLPSTNRYRIIFGTGGDARTVNGSIENTFYDWGGNKPKIENQSSNLQTINFPLKWGYSVVELNPVSGNLKINSNINNNGYWTDVFSGSGKTLTVAGILSGSGGISLKNNGIVIISSASTYTGNTNLEAGTLELQNSISSAEIIVSSGATLRINAENVTINKLTINSGGTVVVEAAKQLTVTGALTNNGTLNLLSTAAGTATLVAPGTITGTGTTNVSQYLKDARNWYVASPVTGATLPASGYTLFERNEVNASWPTPTGTFTQGRGYIAFPDTAASTLTFSGALNLANVDVALTWSGASSKGFNLIGNPYPSHLTWTKAFTDANVALIEPSIYYRTNGGTANNSGLWSTPTYNAFSGASVGGATAIIPPMQAVWVRAIAAGTLTLDNSKLNRSHESSNPLKAPAVVESQKLRLIVTDGQANDEMLVYFNANASNAYDRYDSPKMMNGTNSTIPDIFTMADNEQLVINGMSTIPTEIPLYFKANASTASQFSVSATEFSNFEVGTQVYIKNKNTSIEQLISDGSAYSFNASANPSFSIIIKAPGVISGFDNNSSINFHVFANAIGQITIASPIATGNDVVSVYNAVGQRVLSQNLTSTRTVLNKTFTSGVYVVEINGVAHKVIVK